MNLKMIWPTVNLSFFWYSCFVTLFHLPGKVSLDWIIFAMVGRIITRMKFTNGLLSERKETSIQFKIYTSMQLCPVFSHTKRMTVAPGCESSMSISLLSNSFHRFNLWSGQIVPWQNHKMICQYFWLHFPWHKVSTRLPVMICSSLMNTCSPSLLSLIWNAWSGISFANTLPRFVVQLSFATQMVVLSSSFTWWCAIKICFAFNLSTGCIFSTTPCHWRK